ncbi:MAG: MCE family protein [Hyphomicrobiales bacterium]|nr:MCE family protein [Hyphomicrobiales bacterium]
MKSNKINYFIVGTFVIAMIVGLVGAVAMLTGYSGSTDTYYAVYRNITGVKFGTQVMYEGYPIGQVTEVTPTPDDQGMKFRVDLEVIEGWRIPADSQAQIAAPGLLAAVTISIAAGGSQSMLDPGAEVTSREAENIFTVVSSVADEVGRLSREDVRPLLKNLDKAVVSINNLLETDVQVLMSDLHALYADVGGRLPGIVKDMEVFSANIRDSSQKVRGFLSTENVQMLETVLVNVDGAATNLAQLSQGLEATRRKLDKVIESVDATVGENREDVRKSVAEMRYVAEAVSRHIDEINQNLDGAARNMYEFTRQIRQNPGLLISGTKPEQKSR